MPMKPQGSEPISRTLTGLPEKFSGKTVSIGELKEALSGRSYGIFLLVLALPNLIPLPTPGLSSIVGIPLLLVTFQWMMGLKTPWFPKWIARRTIKLSALSRMIERLLPYIKKLEIILRPRLAFMTSRRMERVLAFICVILSSMILLPIPFGNAFPAFSICLISLGILEEDGVFVGAGLVAAVVSAMLITAAIGSAAISISGLFG